MYLVAPLIRLSYSISNPTRTDGEESDLLDCIPPNSGFYAQPICHRWWDFSVVDIGNPLRSIDLSKICSLCLISTGSECPQRPRGEWSRWNLRLPVTRLTEQYATILQKKTGTVNVGCLHGHTHEYSVLVQFSVCALAWEQWSPGCDDSAMSAFSTLSQLFRYKRLNVIWIHLVSCTSRYWNLHSTGARVVDVRHS